MKKLDQLYMEMISYYQGDPKRIQHFIKVHSLARLIGKLEGMEKMELDILEAAAYVHDIGIKKAEEKYHSTSGTYQEQEGPALAEEMLKKLDFSKEEIDRICFLVGHHHTYSNMEGMDYQILVEADFLVNLYEDNCDKKAVEAAYKKIFRTNTGKEICRKMFQLE